MIILDDLCQNGEPCFDSCLETIAKINHEECIIWILDTNQPVIT